MTDVFILAPPSTFRLAGRHETRVSQVAIDLAFQLRDQLDDTEILIEDASGSLFRSSESASDGGVRIILSYSPMNRPAHDTGRDPPVDTNTDWHRQLRARLDQSISSGRRALVIDVHSFSNGAGPYGRFVAVGNDIEIVYDAPKLVLHKLAGTGRSVRRLVERMHGKHLFPRVLEHTYVNEVSTMALLAGADCLVFDINQEEIWFTDLDVEDLGDLLAEYVNEGIDTPVVHLREVVAAITARPPGWHDRLLAQFDPEEAQRRIDAARKRRRLAAANGGAPY